MEIIYKDKRIIAVNKPAGLSSSPDASGGADAMTECARILSLGNEKSALWLVHRLDNVTAGLLVYARDKDTAAKLSALFTARETEKEYLAVAEGEALGGTLTDYLYKDARQGKAVISDKNDRRAKEATLEYAPIDFASIGNAPLTLVKVKLHTGRFHQIRAQLSAKGHPLVGDGKYGSNVKSIRTPALFSHRIAFTLDGKSYDIKAYPNNDSLPWCLFNKSLFGDTK